MTDGNAQFRPEYRDMQAPDEELAPEPPTLEPTQSAAVHQPWLDKLWRYLFDGDSGGLMSPGQIRREHRDRARVRQLEMAAILEAEQEVNAIHQGTKTLDDHGNLIDTPPVDAVSTHRIIENTAIDQHLDIGLETPAKMLRSVVREVSVRELERSLNLRKIAIQAETEILASEYRPVSDAPVDAEWMTHWRESAENVFNPELQAVWAKVLVLELASPGQFSLGLLAVLRQLSLDELEMVRIVGKYALPDFVYAADQYFQPDHHERLFETMEDLGLMNSSPANKTIPVLKSGNRPLILPIANKALRVSGGAMDLNIRLPILRLTRLGRQIFPLFSDEADLAYLFTLAKELKRQGCTVALGDWHMLGQRGEFSEKMVL